MPSHIPVIKCFDIQKVIPYGRKLRQCLIKKKMQVYEKWKMPAVRYNNLFNLCSLLSTQKYLTYIAVA